MSDPNTSAPTRIDRALLQRVRTVAMVVGVDEQTALNAMVAYALELAESNVFPWKKESTK